MGLKCLIETKSINQWSVLNRKVRARNPQLLIAENRWGQFKMTRILLITFVLILSTSCRQESKVFNDCKCDQLDLRNGMTIKDSLNHYQITYPDSSWMPILNLDTDGNGITVGDTSLGYLRMFAVTELERDFDFADWDEQQEDIESEFNVKEKGTIDYKKQKVHWNLVKFEVDNTWTLYLTVNHPTDKRFYTLNLTVEDGENFKKRLCTLESFLDKFEIVK